MIPTNAVTEGKKPDGQVAVQKEPPRMDDIASPTTKGNMVRSMSVTMRAEKDDLKEAAKDTFNVVVDLNLDGNVRWVSSSWQDVIGTSCDSIQGKSISSILYENTDCFQRATEAMKQDDTRSYKIRFSVVVGPLSAFAQDPVRKAMAAEKEGFRPDEVEDLNILDMEGQGILVFDRGDGQASHTMWVIRPWIEPKEITIDLPTPIIESLGIGAGMLAQYLNALAENDPATHPPPLPVLCRICESQIQPWWFEKHSELCMLEHKAESEVSSAQENLAIQRNAIVKVLDAMERASSSNRSSESSNVEYRGFSIKPPSSGTNSPGAPATRPKETTSTVKSKFGIRRPQVRIVELLLDLCDTALEISTPSIKESLGTGEAGEFRTQSPASEQRIGQVMQWQSPSTNTLEQEHGLALLCSDTEGCAKEKVEAVLRHRNTIEYSERIRYEFATLVQDIIDEARAKASALEDDMDMHSIEADVSEGEDMSEGIMSGSTYMGSVSGRISIGSDPRIRARRYSSPSSSPQECSTPRSGISMGREGGRRSRFSLHASAMSYELDGNESDASVKSSIRGDITRVDSPVSEHGSVSRSHTRTSVDRKRQSLNFLQHGARSPHRGVSPGRVSVGSASPMKAAKPRISALFDGQFPTPITSPLLYTGDFSPALEHGHRRQSSVASSDATKPPLSPRLTSVTPGSQKPGTPSIKDFEIIKPISKGAFGSVYLSKKKSTGDYYAIKVLKKADMIAKNQVTNVRAERAIMMVQGSSDFVAKLFWTFASKDYLYLVMEYLNGGDCAALIKAIGGLSEEWTQKYMAEVILGIEHLHDRGIIHRDLKPDNLLIDQRGHLKLTDFGLSRMGLLGRQKRALQGSSESTPDLLKQGPFLPRSKSQASSRSTSFDFNPGQSSPSNTPVISPEPGPQTSGQPSYFSLSREPTRENVLSRESTLSREATLSRENSMREKGKSSLGRSDSAASDGLIPLTGAFSLNDPASLSMAARRSFYPIDDDAQSTSSASSDISNIHPSSLSAFAAAPPTSSHSMMPPQLALFDPEDSNRKFVGTPDYLAPETINGSGQDEMSDWWSVGCIMFEFLYGYPPFGADTHEKVFDNILNRRIDWPDDDLCPVSAEAKDLMNKLMCTDQERRLGARGADEIKNHPFFAGLNWDDILNDEASFVPAPNDIEDTNYFDSRGATLQEFAEDVEDHTSPGTTPSNDPSDRPHDAVPRGRRDQSVGKRNLMPLHIPPHVRESGGRGRRLSEPLADSEFGTFAFKNLNVLDKANKDLLQKIRSEVLKNQTPTSAAISSPSHSAEGSPILGKGGVSRTLSASSRGGKRAVSPSNLHSSMTSPPSRGSQPSSPLLMSFSAHHPHRKTSNASTTSTSSFALNSGQVEIPRISTKVEGPSPITDSANVSPTRLHNISPIRIQAPSKIFGKSPQAPLSPRKEHGLSSQSRSGFARVRSLTVGSQDGDPPAFVDSLKHSKRHSQVFDMSPSSSDNEDNRSSALLRVQRRRQSSQRISTISLHDGPVSRPLDILVCEDHPVSRMVMERMLEKLQCRTMSVETGPEAVGSAMSEVKFDLILTEYKLPQINGDDLARMIKTTKNLNNTTPIVCVTGYLRDLKDPHHFDDLIEKPATPQSLTDVMERLCSWIPPLTPTTRNSPMVFPVDKNRPPVPPLPTKGFEMERRPSLDRTYTAPLPRTGSSLLSTKSAVDNKAQPTDKGPKKAHSDEAVPRVQNRMDTLTPPPSSLGEEFMLQKFELNQKSTERARSQLSVSSLASPPPTPPRPPIPDKSGDRVKSTKSSTSSPLKQHDFINTPEIKKPTPAPAASSLEVKMPIPTSIAKPITLEKPEKPVESQVKIVSRQPVAPVASSSASSTPKASDNKKPEAVTQKVEAAPQKPVEVAKKPVEAAKKPAEAATKPAEASKKPVEVIKKAETPVKSVASGSKPAPVTIPSTSTTKPTVPVTPVKQTAPVTPVKQTAPITPVKQTAPVTPVKQTAPVAPPKQTAPVSPSKQTVPVTPAKQTVPVTPAKQTAPVVPASQPTLVTPVKQTVTATSTSQPAANTSMNKPVATTSSNKPAAPTSPTATKTPVKQTPPATVPATAPVTSIKQTIPVTPAKQTVPPTPTKPTASAPPINQAAPVASSSKQAATNAPIKPSEAISKAVPPTKQPTPPTKQPTSPTKQPTSPVKQVEASAKPNPTPAQPTTPVKPTEAPKKPAETPKVAIKPASPVELLSNLKKTISGSSSSSTASTSPKQTRFQSPPRVTSPAPVPPVPVAKGDLSRGVNTGKPAPEAPARKASISQMPPSITTVASTPKAPSTVEPTTPKATQKVVSKSPEPAPPKNLAPAPKLSPTKAKVEESKTPRVPEASSSKAPKIVEPTTPKPAQGSSKQESPATVKPAKADFGRKSPSPETVSKARSFRNLLTGKTPDTVDSAHDDKSLKSPKPPALKEKRSRGFLSGDFRKKSDDSK